MTCMLTPPLVWIDLLGCENAGIRPVAVTKGIQSRILKARARWNFLPGVRDWTGEEKVEEMVYRQKEGMEDGRKLEAEKQVREKALGGGTAGGFSRL